MALLSAEEAVLEEIPTSTGELAEVGEEEKTGKTLTTFSRRRSKFSTLKSKKRNFIPLINLAIVDSAAAVVNK